jgi:hypothetical protein
LLFTTIVFIWISYWVANATNILTKMIVGATNAKLAAGLPAPVTAAVATPSSGVDAGIGSAAEENIPLVNTVNRSSLEESSGREANIASTDEKIPIQGEDRVSQAMRAQDGPIMVSVPGAVDGSQGVPQAPESELHQHSITAGPSTLASAETAAAATETSNLPLPSPLVIRLSLILATMWILNIVWPSQPLSP